MKNGDNAVGLNPVQHLDINEGCRNETSKQNMSTKTSPGNTLHALACLSIVSDERADVLRGLTQVHLGVSGQAVFELIDLAPAIQEELKW